MRTLAKVVIVLVGIVAVFFLTGLLANLLPPDTSSLILVGARVVILILSTWIIMQVAARIEKRIDRKP